LKEFRSIAFVKNYTSNGSIINKTKPVEFLINIQNNDYTIIVYWYFFSKRSSKWSVLFCTVQSNGKYKRQLYKTNLV